MKGTWVGIFLRTGEHIVVLPSGEAIRVRTIHRVPEEDRWDSEAVTAIRALPRRPVPQRDDADPMPRTAGQERPTEEGREDDVGGSNLERPIVMKDQKVPRELRIDGRLLEKFGYTDECLGCFHRQMKEPGHRPHSSACRRRI